MGQLLQRCSTTAVNPISTTTVESLQASRCLSGKQVGFTTTGDGCDHQLLLSCGHRLTLVLHRQATPALTGVGERAGLDRGALAAYLASDDRRENVLRADFDARQTGINAVPFFLFDRRTTVSGAHAPETLLQAMLDARSREEA